MVAIRSGVLGLNALQLVVSDFAHGTVLVQTLHRAHMERNVLTWEVSIRPWIVTVEWTVLMREIALKQQNATIQVVQVYVLMHFLRITYKFILSIAKHKQV